MGMVLILKRASNRDLVQLHSCPKAIHRFLSDEYEVVKPAATGPTKLFKKLFKADPDSIVFDTYETDDEFDTDKLWHGLYYLLTETAWGGNGPACYLLNATSIGKEEVGYGPAMAITAQQTAELSAYLNNLDRQTIVDRFDAARMNELDIYPNFWDDDEDELKAELGDLFDGLKAYCQACSDRNLGMISYLT